MTSSPYQPTFPTLREAQAAGREALRSHPAGRAVLAALAPPGERGGWTQRLLAAWRLARLPRRERWLARVSRDASLYERMTPRERREAGLPVSGWVRTPAPARELPDLPDVKPARPPARTAADMTRQLLVNAAHRFFDQAGGAQLADGTRIEDTPAGQELLRAMRRLHAAAPPADYLCRRCGWLGSVLALRHYNHRLHTRDVFHFACPQCGVSADANGESVLAEQVSGEEMSHLLA